jgi:hypothetical protein
VEKIHENNDCKTGLAILVHILRIWSDNELIIEKSVRPSRGKSCRLPFIENVTVPILKYENEINKIKI